MTSTPSTPGTARTVVPLPERDPDDLLTLTEAADILRVPVNTLRWWRQQGTGPEFFKIGRHLVTTVGDLRRYIGEQRQGGSMGIHRSLAGRPGRP